MTQSSLNLEQKKLTQQERILCALQNAREFGAGWIDGVAFINGAVGKPILQYHARLFELERQGYQIEGTFLGDNNYKSYRLK